MKRITTLIFMLLLVSLVKAQTYQLGFDSVRIKSPLLLGTVTTGNSTDSVLVKRPNGRIGKVARSSFGSGTVTSVTPGIGFNSSTPITSSGTLNIDTVTATTGLARKGFILNYAYSKAQLDAIAVHLTGNETIAGVKTFSGTPVFASGLVVRNATFAFLHSASGFVGSIVPPASPAANYDWQAPGKSGTLALTSDLATDTLMFAGGGSLSTIPTLPGKRRITVIGSGTFPNVNLPASAAVGDVFILTGGVHSAGGTANYYNNASGDLIEGNDGTGLKVTTAGTSGYISVQVGSTATLMLISTAPKLYHVISYVGQVTFH